MSLPIDRIRDLVIQAIKQANTLASDRVYGPYDWPLTAKNLPAILVDWLHESKQATGPGLGYPKFTSVGLMEIQIHTRGASAAAVKAQISSLLEQIHGAILSNAQLHLDLRQQAGLQKIIRVETQIGLSAEATDHEGQAMMRIGFEYYEEFPPIITARLDEIAVRVRRDGKDLASILIKQQ